MSLIDKAYQNFENNINSCNELIEVYSIIQKKLPDLEDKSKDILRSVIVLSVSALDTFLHDFYRTEIVESFLDSNKYNVKFENIQINIKWLKEINNFKTDEEKKSYLIKELRKIQIKDSYQSPKSVEYIFSNLGISKIWNQIEKKQFKKYNSKNNNEFYTAQEIKIELSVIIQRRNQIAHESDWDYIRDEKQNIFIESAQHTVYFIHNFIKIIKDIS